MRKCTKALAICSPLASHSTPSGETRMISSPSARHSSATISNVPRAARARICIGATMPAIERCGKGSSNPTRPNLRSGRADSHVITRQLSTRWQSARCRSDAPTAALQARVPARHPTCWRTRTRHPRALRRGYREDRDGFSPAG